MNPLVSRDPNNNLRISDSCTNSFLNETVFNTDIDEHIRSEIEKKFLKSKINGVYRFPRVLPNEGRLLKGRSKPILTTIKNNPRGRINGFRKGPLKLKQEWHCFSPPVISSPLLPLKSNAKFIASKTPIPIVDKLHKRITVKRIPSRSPQLGTAKIHRIILKG